MHWTQRDNPVSLDAKNRPDIFSLVGKAITIGAYWMELEGSSIHDLVYISIALEPNTSVGGMFSRQRFGIKVLQKSCLVRLSVITLSRFARRLLQRSHFLSVRDLCKVRRSSNLLGANSWCPTRSSTSLRAPLMIGEDFFWVISDYGSMIARVDRSGSAVLPFLLLWLTGQEHAAKPAAKPIIIAI
jgi:hypothetical protein